MIDDAPVQPALPKRFRLIHLVCFVCFVCLASCGGGEQPANAPVAPARAAVDTSDASTPMSAGGANPEGGAPEGPRGWPFTETAPDDARRALLAGLKKDDDPTRTNWTPPGRSERYGRAEALIAASYDVVRARIADFSRYKDLAGPKFKKVSLVDKLPTGETDLYFQLPIMKGVVTIWYIARFTAPRRLAQEGGGGGGGEVVEGLFVKGNIKGMHFVFTVRPGPTNESSVLSCDLLLSLNMAAPQGDVDQALRDACGDAVKAVRAQTTKPSP